MRKFSLLIITATLSLACQQSSGEPEPVQHDTIHQQPQPSTEYGLNIETRSVQTVAEKETAETGCKFADGLHTATVNYVNPKTNYTAQYELNVHVNNCKIIQIDFPNGGWLDEDHIKPAKIDEQGNATLKDDKERNWTIHLH